MKEREQKEQRRYLEPVEFILKNDLQLEQLGLHFT